MANLIRKRNSRRINERQYLEEKSRVLAMLDTLSLFGDTSDEAREKRLKKAKKDFWAFAHEYLPHYFTTETQAEFHDELAKSVDVLELPQVFAAPRGFAKSTILSFAVILWNILFERKKFIVLIMETLPKAEMQTYRILLELLYNERIIHDFGKIVSEEAGRGDFQTLTSDTRKHPVRLTALGAGMSARGLTNKQFRPDLIICDDLENRKLARNPHRVAELEKVVLGDYLGATSANKWSFIVVGTVICRGSLLDRLLKRERYRTRKFQALVRDAKGQERSTWEELHPTKKLQDLRLDMGSSLFAAEKQNEPMEEDGTFRESWITSWQTWPSDLSLRELIIQVDPSYSETGDNKAMFPGVEYSHTKESPNFGKWHDADGKLLEEGVVTMLLDCYNRKASIDEMILQLYAWNKRYSPTIIRIDGTYAQKKVFEREFSRYEATHGVLPIKFDDQSQRGSKKERILSLEPLLQRRKILFPPRTTPDMEETVIQFTRFGETGVADDAPDCIEALVHNTRRRKKASVTFG
jgi:hypothetical protein